MKLLKTLSVGLMAAACVGTASAAPTIIHVAGSTAFRGQTTIAIMDALANNVPTALGSAPAGGDTTVYAAYDPAGGKNITSAKSQIFANGTIGSGGTATIIVECFWTGSLSGVVDLVSGVSQATFLDETNANVISALNGDSFTPATGSYPATATIGQITGTPAYHATNQVVDMAMSDSNKATISAELGAGTCTLSGTLGTFTTIKALATACKAGNVEQAGTNGQTRVGIVPFMWVLGKHTDTNTSLPTNMTQQQSRALFNTGAVSQGLFSGGSTAADTNNYIYLTGRDEDSGTRIGALAESQNGVTTGVVKQWQIGDGAATFSPIALFPANSPLNTESQIVFTAAGHTGYATGSNVAFALDFANTGTNSITGKPAANTGNSYFVGYLGLSDAKTAVTGGATALSYNGVPFSYPNVSNGSYTFWTYEYCYRLSAHDGDTVGNFIDSVSDLLTYADVDAAYATTGAVSHTYNGGIYTGSTISTGGMFDALSVNRSTTEGLPVTN